MHGIRTRGKALPLGAGHMVLRHWLSQQCLRVDHSSLPSTAPTLLVGSQSLVKFAYLFQGEGAAVLKGGVNKDERGHLFGQFHAVLQISSQKSSMCYLTIGALQQQMSLM